MEVALKLIGRNKFKLGIDEILTSDIRKAPIQSPFVFFVRNKRNGFYQSRCFHDRDSDGADPDHDSIQGMERIDYLGWKLQLF